MMREVTIEERAGMAVLWNASQHLHSYDNGCIMNYIAFALLRALYTEIKLGRQEHPLFDYRRYLIEGDIDEDIYIAAANEQ